MASETKNAAELKIAYVLFMDIVGYSKLMVDEQRELVERLKQVVRGTTQFQKADAESRLTKISTGDGMALVFYNNPEAPVECALEICRALKNQPELPLRMGVHSGPVSGVLDVNDADGVAGAGINMSQRVMDCGDAGHILLSKHVSEDLEHYARWKPHLHDVGECEVKHGVRVHLFNLYTEEVGNPKAPEIFRRTKAKEQLAPLPSVEKKEPASERISICVLPFSNMSGETEQAYFSDGISEDIITDLSKVSALHVVSRHTAFTFKGKPGDVRQIASQLNVTHVLEGSVRKAAGRVRISAQLIDATNDSHIWAERYDRDLNDIFALQDEISRAIVDALKVKLLPEEKKAIEKRGTKSVEAYNLYLMARQAYATGFEWDKRRNEGIIRLCRRATEIDPNYADAWALIAWAETLLGSAVAQVQNSGAGLAAAERALALNPDLAEAHAVRARLLTEENRHDEASIEIEAALRLDPESHEVNKCAAVLRFWQRRLEEAIRYLKKAVALEEMDFTSAGLLITCYTALENREAAREVARIALARAEKVLAHDPTNGPAMGHGSNALAALGQGERAQEWMNRALLFDPDNVGMRFNFACALATYLKNNDAACEMFASAVTKMGPGSIKMAKVDPDLDPIRDDPRFQAMIAAAEARLATQRSA